MPHYLLLSFLNVSKLKGNSKLGAWDQYKNMTLLESCDSIEIYKKLRMPSLIEINLSKKTKNLKSYTF